MRRLVVTGGAGPLGFRLCDRLVAHAEEVLCLKDFPVFAMAERTHSLRGTTRGVSFVERPVYDPCTPAITLAASSSAGSVPSAVDEDLTRTIAWVS